MLNIFFGNKLVRASLEVQEALTALELPIPIDFAKANSFSATCGREPSRGYLFMDRPELAGAGFLDSLHDLTFTYFDALTGTTETRTFYSLVVTKEPINLIPSHVAGDTASVYLVEIADARWRVCGDTFHQSTTTMYNVSSNADNGAGGPDTFLPASLDGGVTPWTWATMCADLWNVMAPQLGAFPGLPFTPDGEPAGWLFQGASCWDSLCDVLDRIGCTVRPDHTKATGQYTIVQIGKVDVLSDLALAGAIATDRKIHDGEFLPIVRGKIPYGVLVLFDKVFELPTQIPPWLRNEPHTIQIVGPDAASAEPDIYHPIRDDMLALYDDTDTLTNGAALATRAAERAADFYRMLRLSGGGRFWMRFTGLLAIAPGSTIKTVTWSAPAAGGIFTDVSRRPAEIVPPTRAGTVQDLIRLGFPSDVGGGGNCPEETALGGMIEFKKSGTWTSPACETTIEYWLIGKGGHGGQGESELDGGGQSEGDQGGGGGGAGEFLVGSVAIPGSALVTVTIDDSITQMNLAADIEVTDFFAAVGEDGGGGSGGGSGGAGGSGNGGIPGQNGGAGGVGLSAFGGDGGSITNPDGTGVMFAGGPGNGGFEEPGTGFGAGGGGGNATLGDDPGGIGGGGYVRLTWSGSKVSSINGQTGAVTITPASGTGIGIAGAANSVLEVTGPLVNDKLPSSKGGLNVDAAAWAAGSFPQATGAGAFIEKKNNYAGAGPPTVTDDSSIGYSIGSAWVG